MNQTRILIVAHDRENALELKRTLGVRGYEATEIVTSGADALASARVSKPDLILIDMGLGGQPDGIDAAAGIYHTLDIPVIYLISASCDFESAKRSRETSPYGYIRVPAGECELFGSITSALDRHRSDRLAKESRENFRTVFEQSFHLMGLIDNEGRVITINLKAKSYLNTIGVDYAEVIGRPFWETPWWSHSPEQQQRLQDAIKKAAQGGVVQFEAHHPWADGSSIIVDFSLKPVFDSAFNVIHMLAEGSDITEQKRVEEALRESETRFRDLANLLPQTIYECDMTGKLTFANQYALQSFGITQEDVDEGVNVFSFIAPEQHVRVFGALEKLLQGVRTSGNEYTAVRRDGTTFPILIYSSIIERHGAACGIRGVIIEITERKRIEDALRESESLYRAIFENTGTASIIIDENTIIQLCNTEWINLAGYPREEMEGKMSWTKFVVEEDLEIMKEYHRTRRLDPSAAPLKYEFRYLKRNGEIRHMINHVGMVPGTKKSIASIMDITERKRAEDALKDSLREKETLLKEIHHRVKNNMQIMVSLLNLQKGSLYSDEARKMFTEMQNRIRAMALIHEKLYTTADLSSIEFGEYIKRITAELRTTYEGITSNISITIQAGKVYLGIDQAIPCGLIINELVSNALKYAFAGRNDMEGELRISIKEKPGSIIELEISDNGIGLPEEVDFGDQSKTLGLKLVDLLTRQLRGSLDISRNGGTSYFIRFARKEPSETKPLI